MITCVYLFTSAECCPFLCLPMLCCWVFTHDAVCVAGAGAESAPVGHHQHPGYEWNHRLHATILLTGQGILWVLSPSIPSSLYTLLHTNSTALRQAHNLSDLSSLSFSFFFSFFLSLYFSLSFSLFFSFFISLCVVMSQQLLILEMFIITLVTRLLYRRQYDPLPDDENDDEHTKMAIPADKSDIAWGQERLYLCM